MQCQEELKKKLLLIDDEKLNLVQIMTSEYIITLQYSYQAVTYPCQVVHGNFYFTRLILQFRSTNV